MCIEIKMGALNGNEGGQRKAKHNKAHTEPGRQRSNIFVDYENVFGLDRPSNRCMDDRQERKRANDGIEDWF